MARFLSSNDPETLLQLMEEIDSDFSDDDFDGFIDENDDNEKKDDCFSDEETSNITTTFSSSGTTSSSTSPTNYPDISIPQYQEKPD